MKTFALTLVDGKYSFLCDAHPSRMSGSFTAGQHLRGAPKPPPAKPPVQLVLTLTGKAVGLSTPAGRPVKTIASGSVVITVRDRSSTRGIRLTGAGVSRSTGVRFVGTATWRVKLVQGARLRERPGEAGRSRRARHRLLTLRPRPAEERVLGSIAVVRRLTTMLFGSTSETPH